MRDQEIVGLWESYLQVCENQQLDEVSDELVDRAVNKRIARTGAAYDAEMRDRTPENMRNSVRAGEKEASMKNAAAKRRKRINNEEVETWVNSLIEEGYDLSKYTWDDMFEMYMNLDEGNKEENETGMSNVSKLRRRQKKFAAGIVHPDEAGELEGERQKAHKSGRYVPTRGSGVREGYDTFDTILEHLIAEGYADTNESALKIIENMSEEWAYEILEGYKKLPVGKMIKQAAYKAYYASKDGDEKVDKQVAKMARVASRHSTIKGKAKLKTGMSIGEVERQGRRNKGDYSG